MTNVEAPKGAEKPKAEVSPLIPLRKGAVAMIAKKIIAGLIIFLIYVTPLIYSSLKSTAHAYSHMWGGFIYDVLKTMQMTLYIKIIMASEKNTATMNFDIFSGAE
ncbi:hypothetical protein [Serratia quinivorans]|uniref:hypothetical protein n=1 Tax=Serratia quinivorans TaxID=137545 RepID=UPI00217A1053|nr:hypothetical protein [Serratia quinivorans]CAI0700541.1 Uncharacterised protein [Serratia quinivorans]